MNKQEAFKQVLEQQSKYDFLEHQEVPKSSKERKQELIKRIDEKIEQIKQRAAMYYFMLLAVFSLTFASCEKQEYDEPKQMITQELTLQGSNIVYDMQKSFNPDEWQYNYSNVQYELKLESTDGKYQYVKTVSIIELLQGTVTFQMWAGTYNITYTPVHQQKFDNVLDVSINMANVNIQGSPIVLQGILQDALVIFDRTDIFPIIDEQGQPVFYQDARGFWYAYVNSAFTVRLIVQATGLQIPISLTPEMGKVYWYSNQGTNNVTLDIPEMEVIRQTF